MPEYHFYFLSNTKVLVGIPACEVCADDADALSRAAELAINAPGSTHTIEVWELARLVSRLGIAG
jgi:hypothetical protein